MIGATQVYRLAYPRLTHRFSGIPAMPWLQLGDKVTIEPAAHSGTNIVTTARAAVITALSFSWRPEGAFVMGLEAADAAGLYEYSDYHRLDTDDYGERRVFV
jgi:hypothetical protein